MTSNSEIGVSVAALVLFSTQPSDRALEGWCAADWTAEEITNLAAYVRQERTGTT